jgi:hypothetical protein
MSAQNARMRDRAIKEYPFRSDVEQMDVFKQGMALVRRTHGELAGAEPMEPQRLTPAQGDSVFCAYLASRSQIFEFRLRFQIEQMFSSLEILN